MKLYDIPDIRLFWSNDPTFLMQFNTINFAKNITYQAPVSKYTFTSTFLVCFQNDNHFVKFRYNAVICDMSFYLPENSDLSKSDFYDLVREVGGDLVEQCECFDDFVHPKSKVSLMVELSDSIKIYVTVKPNYTTFWDLIQCGMIREVA